MHYIVLFFVMPVSMFAATNAWMDPEVTPQLIHQLTPLKSKLLSGCSKDNMIFDVEAFLGNMSDSTQEITLFLKQNRAPCIAQWLNALLTPNTLVLAKQIFFATPTNSGKWLSDAFVAIESAITNPANTAGDLAQACQLLGGTNNDWDTFCSLQQTSPKSTAPLAELATYKGKFSKEGNTFYATLIHAWQPQAATFKIFLPFQNPVTPPRLLEAHELTQEHAEHLAPLALRIIHHFTKKNPEFDLNRFLWNMFDRTEALELFRQQHRVPCVADWLHAFVTSDLLNFAEVTLLSEESNSGEWLREAFNAAKRARKKHNNAAEELAKACQLLGGTNSDWETFCSLQEISKKPVASPTDLAAHKGTFAKNCDFFYAQLIRILYPESKLFKAFLPLQESFSLPHESFSLPQESVAPPRRLGAHELTQEHAEHLVPLGTKIFESCDTENRCFNVKRFIFNMFGQTNAISLFCQQHRVPCVALWLSALPTPGTLGFAIETFIASSKSNVAWLSDAFTAIENATTNPANAASDFAKACQLLGGTNNDWEAFCSLQETAQNPIADPKELVTYKGKFPKEIDTFYYQLLRILYPLSQTVQAVTPYQDSSALPLIEVHELTTQHAESLSDLALPLHISGCNINNIFIIPAFLLRMKQNTRLAQLLKQQKRLPCTAQWLSYLLDTEGLLEAQMAFNINHPQEWPNNAFMAIKNATTKPANAAALAKACHILNGTNSDWAQFCLMQILTKNPAAPQEALTAYKGTFAKDSDPFYATLMRFWYPQSDTFKAFMPFEENPPSASLPPLVEAHELTKQHAENLRDLSSTFHISIDNLSNTFIFAPFLNRLRHDEGKANLFKKQRRFPCLAHWVTYLLNTTNCEHVQVDLHMSCVGEWPSAALAAIKIATKNPTNAAEALAKAWRILNGTNSDWAQFCLMQALTENPTAPQEALAAHKGTFAKDSDPFYATLMRFWYPQSDIFKALSPFEETPMPKANTQFITLTREHTIALHPIIHHLITSVAMPCKSFRIITFLEKVQNNPKTLPFLNQQRRLPCIAQWLTHLAQPKNRPLAIKMLLNNISTETVWIGKAFIAIKNATTNPANAASELAKACQLLGGTNRDWDTFCAMQRQTENPIASIEEFECYKNTFAQETDIFYASLISQTDSEDFQAFLPRKKDDMIPITLPSAVAQENADITQEKKQELSLLGPIFYNSVEPKNNTLCIRHLLENLKNTPGAIKLFQEQRRAPCVARWLNFLTNAQNMTIAMNTFYPTFDQSNAWVWINEALSAMQACNKQPTIAAHAAAQACSALGGTQNDWEQFCVMQEYAETPIASYETLQPLKNTLKPNHDTFYATFMQAMYPQTKQAAAFLPLVFTGEDMDIS